MDQYFVVKAVPVSRCSFLRQRLAITLPIGEIWNRTQELELRVC
ncbi:hypothetical protein EVA_09864 [gut metagenome]|uniref:Uncharacterized protein n=1 Tax=gut metagenome TaxID=749906 RepID=J9GPY1_9ZZZZ